MTIEENIAMVPEMLGWEEDRISARVDELLELVDLDSETYRSRYPFELSGGQQQRVGVSRALASDPNIILMDEPFSALDPISREQLQDELRKLQRKIKKTIVFVTHDMDEALEIADEIIIMREGQIEQLATPDELIEHQATDFVRDFIGQNRIARRRDFAQRKLGEFTDLLDETWAGDSLKVDSLITVQGAIDLLEENSNRRLAITSQGKIVGYLGHHTLLKAAMNDREGELSV
jgi:osmoprotectant transport system ATP-binding protein